MEYNVFKMFWNKHFDHRSQLVYLLINRIFCLACKILNVLEGLVNTVTALDTVGVQCDYTTLTTDFRRLGKLQTVSRGIHSVAKL